MTIEEVKTQIQSQNELLDRLIPEMASGNMQALEEVYSQTKSAVYGFALSILKNPQTAEDVMQDTYVRLYRASPSYLPMGKPMAWILTITRNLSLMKLREGKNTEILDEGNWPDVVDGSDFAANSTDRITLHAAFTILSDEERQIVTLHALGGLKHRETADLLKMPLSTVLNKYRRALSELKKEISEKEEEQ